MTAFAAGASVAVAETITEDDLGGSSLTGDAIDVDCFKTAELLAVRVGIEGSRSTLCI